MKKLITLLLLINSFSHAQAYRRNDTIKVLVLMCDTHSIRTVHAISWKKEAGAHVSDWSEKSGICFWSYAYKVSVFKNDSFYDWQNEKMKYTSGYWSARFFLNINKVIFSENIVIWQDIELEEHRKPTSQSF